MSIDRNISAWCPTHDWVWVSVTQRKCPTCGQVLSNRAPKVSEPHGVLSAHEHALKLASDLVVKHARYYPRQSKPYYVAGNRKGFYAADTEELVQLVAKYIEEQGVTK